MKLSIIVVSIGTPPLVERLFTSLAAQTCKNFEVVFVHGPGISVDVARGLARSLPGLGLVVLPSADICLSRSRNLGLRVATGSIIAFADDDCIYEPDTVAEVFAAFEKNSAAHVIMGTPTGIKGAVRSKSHTAICLNRYAVFSNCPSYVHFYKAEVVQTVGQFDEQLGVGCGTPFLSGEETDYALRALEAEFSIFCVPAVVVRHPAVDLRDPALTAKARAYAAGRMRVLRKNNLPLWFALANVAYPLFRMPLDCLAECGYVLRYRWAMFTARLLWLRGAK